MRRKNQLPKPAGGTIPEWIWSLQANTLKKFQTVGTIEAVKTVADIYSPIDGTIIEINQDIESDPEFVNSDPYSKGWLIKMKFSDSSDFKNLLTNIEYKELIS